jgi:hypothetical protein
MSRFRPHPDVLTRRVGDEVVLVHSRRNEVFALNATGGRLWELFSEGRTPSEAVEQLTVEFDVTREAADKETSRLLTMLQREGLLAEER